MKLKELVDKCRTKDYTYIEIRDKDNNYICDTKANGAGVLPYKDYEVLEWFPSCNFGPLNNNNKFCVSLDYGSE